MGSSTRVTALLAALVASGLIAAGCGDDDDDGDGASSVSKAEYIAEVDKICDDFRDRIGELPDPDNLGQLAKGSRVVQRIADEGIADARSVELPEDQTFVDAVDAYYDSLEADFARLDAMREAAEAGKGKEAERIAETAVEAQKSTVRQAKALGFKACSQSE